MRANVVSGLVLLLAAAVALTVLVASPTAASQGHFVRVFADSTGTTSAAPEPSVRSVATAAPAGGTVREILTMKGGWTSDIGDEIARRALRWVGTPYSFAGGNADGPTLGTPVDYDSRNDGHVVGFDCSGLVMYALAPYLTVTHLASAQYTQAGQAHPALNQLLPGDLVFWSSDGTVQGIGHVAIYIGDGKVVQAPESGELVKITPLDQVESGAIGTTRPLTRL